MTNEKSKDPVSAILEDAVREHFEASASVDELTVRVVERGGTEQTIGEAMALRKQLEQEQ